ncbi:MAG: RES family NAD+ phosphorylase [Pseudomonadales bacterium]|nr:RES family NAD+ phosphorylase [Pseudomonadales bacterium]
MAKRASSPASSGNTPPPPERLHVATMIWTSAMTLHRIHLACYSGDQLNPGVKGNARFSPIKNGKGKAIPTLYGGSSFECAAMETVFHDIAFTPGYKHYDKAKLTGQVHSQLTLSTDVILADLRSKALRKLGISRKQLIDTEKDQYPATRRWAEAIHAQYPAIQGLCWTSRQDDSARAVILFGDRIGKGVLRQTGASRHLLDDATAYEELMQPLTKNY